MFEIPKDAWAGVDMGRAGDGAFGVQADVLRAMTLPQHIERCQDKDHNARGGVNSVPTVQCLGADTDTS